MTRVGSLEVGVTILCFMQAVFVLYSAVVTKLSVLY